MLSSNIILKKGLGQPTIVSWFYDLGGMNNVHLSSSLTIPQTSRDITKSKEAFVRSLWALRSILLYNGAGPSEPLSILAVTP